MIGYSGAIEWETSKPDGVPRELLDSSRLRALGWQPAVDFEEGLKGAYQWCLDNALSKETCS
jgi:GDP-L-fucose synthase